MKERTLPWKHWNFVLAAVLPVILLLLVIEGGGRLLIHLHYGVPGKTYGLWRYDEVLGAQHRENAYNASSQTNDSGFRNLEPVNDPKPPGALRVIAYGGSTTFCYNLTDSETWTSQLEQLLREHNKVHDQVLNGGAIMWSLSHAYARAQRDIPRLKPDYVLIYSGINEEANAHHLAAAGISIKELVQKGEYGAFATNLDQNRWIKRNLVTVRLVDYVVMPLLHRFQPRPITDSLDGSSELGLNPDPYILKNYLEVLAAFIRLTAFHGGRTVFIVQAFGGSQKKNVYLTSYSRAGAKLAKEMGAMVVDANRIIENYEGDSMDLFYKTGVHYSRLGAKKLAEHLYSEVFATY